MRVCYFGFYDPEYPRNASIRRGLEMAGVTVLECRGPMHLAPTHMRGAGVSGFGQSRIRFEIDAARRWFLARRHLKAAFRELEGPIDAVVVAEFNQELVPLARRLIRGTGTALVVDFFVSLFETSVIDREAVSRLGPRALVRKRADRQAIRLADRVIVDTVENGEHYDALFGGLNGKMVEIPIGALEHVHYPLPLPDREGGPLNVLWFGSYIPLHGLDTIIRAAALLGPRCRFNLIGGGQLYDRITALIEAEGCTNVILQDWAGPEELRQRIRESDVCLGIFGTTRKALGCVPNKVWQCLASGRPVVTADTPTSRRVLDHGENVLLVPPGDPQALAAELERLAENPELAREIAANAARFVSASFTSEALGRRLLDELEDLTGPDESAGGLR